MSAPTLRLLLVEDNPDDAELLVREIRRAGMPVTHQIADSKDSLQTALATFAPDAILSDFSMPGFDGMEALRLAVEAAPDVPFIFVSGTLGEEYAIRALKNGATDYVLKTNLLRLPASVERALEEARIRRERRRTEVELEIARERLREREAGLARAQHMARLAHVITGTDGAFKTWSESLPDLVGVDRSQMPRSTRDWLSAVHPDDTQILRQASIEAATSNERRDVSYRLRRGDGSWIQVLQVIEPLDTRPGADGEMRWFNTLQDVTEHKDAEDKIKRLNRVYAVLSGINSLIVREPTRDELCKEACRIAVDSGQLRMAWLGIYDQSGRRIVPIAWHGHENGFLGLMSLSLDDPGPEGRGLVRRALREQCPVVINDMEKDAKFRLRHEAQARGYRSGAVMPLMVSGNLVGVIGFFAGEPDFFDDGELRLLTELAGDISYALNHIEKAEKLDYFAFYDSLTGLSNRTLLLDRLNQFIQVATENEASLAVVVSDLERFRAVNDSLGRQAGDALLTQFSERLKAAAPEEQQLSRIGADQFVVVLPAIKNAMDAARQLTELGQACLGEPFRVGDRELRLSAKAGIAIFPSNGADAETLLSNAEAALKRCKANGERYLFFEQEMTERVAQDLNLENQLRRAIEREEFVLHYQPRVELSTGRITGVEALIRWQNEGRLVPPGNFIPLLEETGLILEVGAWALRQAVREHQSWLDQGVKAPRVAVNVSAVQLRQRDFVSRVRRTVGGVAGRPSIDLEITESMIMDDIAGNIDKLRAVRDLGLGVAIDDFGTGYSSLAYLAKLPVESLKIDRSFIITMLNDANAMTLVSMIISLAHALKLKVVAEGVDSEDQAQALRGLGCDEMQGYLFSKPIPGENLLALLTKAG